jgi:hypothetical protein
LSYIGPIVGGDLRGDEKFTPKRGDVRRTEKEFKPEVGDIPRTEKEFKPEVGDIPRTEKILIWIGGASAAAGGAPCASHRVLPGDSRERIGKGRAGGDRRHP